MGTKTKMSEPSIVSSPFKDNDLSLLVLIFLFNYLQNTMSHNLHGNISIKCLEIKKRFSPTFVLVQVYGGPNLTYFLMVD